MSDQKNSRRVLAAAVLSSALLGACASAPTQSAALDEARTAFQRANADQNIARLAPDELASAQSALRRAEQASVSREPADAVNHMAYLARQRTAVATEMTRAKVAEQQIQDAGREREQLALMAQANNAQAQADATKVRNQQLRDQLAALKAKETERGMVLTLGDVLFDSARATLKPGAMSTLSRLARFMKENPGRNVAVEGHTDSTGNADRNQSLSERRAESVKSALVTRYGVDPVRIVTSGHGDTLPIADNDTAAGRQQNRRVEIIVSDENGVVAPRRNEQPR